MDPLTDLASESTVHHSAGTSRTPGRPRSHPTPEHHLANLKTLDARSSRLQLESLQLCCFPLHSETLPLHGWRLDISPRRCNHLFFSFSIISNVRTNICLFSIVPPLGCKKEDVPHLPPDVCPRMRDSHPTSPGSSRNLPHINIGSRAPGNYRENGGNRFHFEQIVSQKALMETNQHLISPMCHLMWTYQGSLWEALTVIGRR